MITKRSLSPELEDDVVGHDFSDPMEDVKMLAQTQSLKAPDRDSSVLTLTVQLACAYLNHHALKSQELFSFMKETYGFLETLTHEAERKAAGPLMPAVPISQSVKPDYIVCLEDGKKLKMLRRYLRSRYNMTPEEYRRRWNLPPDYPLVAPNYSDTRSKLAVRNQLGKGNSRRKKKA